MGPGWGSAQLPRDRSPDPSSPLAEPGDPRHMFSCANIAEDSSVLIYNPLRILREMDVFIKMHNLK